MVQISRELDHKDYGGLKSPELDYLKRQGDALFRERSIQNKSLISMEYKERQLQKQALMERTTRELVQESVRER